MSQATGPAQLPSTSASTWASVAGPSPAAPVAPPTSLGWRSSRLVGGLSFSFNLTTESPMDCHLARNASMRADPPGINEVTLYEQKGSSGWSAGGSGYLAQAHAGLVDTRTLLGSGGITASRTTLRAKSPIHVTMVMQNLTPWPGDGFAFMPANETFDLSIHCTKPPVLTDLQGSHEAFIFDQDSMSGGAGASVLFEASVAAADHASATLTSSRVIARSGSFLYHAGILTFSHEGKNVDCIMIPDSTGACRLDGGPGDYAATLTRVGAEFDAFWGLFAGLAPVQNLSELGLEPSPTA